VKYGPIIINHGSNIHAMNHPITEGKNAFKRVML
ncbi:uncharacterized protein METZ01_LOCUS34563, partial [marine metagenome]